jgi:hypothetical protein
MKRFCVLAMVLSMLSFGTIGCTQKSATTEETTVSSPDETTAVTVEKEVDKPVENPPAEQN